MFQSNPPEGPPNKEGFRIIEKYPAVNNSSILILEKMDDLELYYYIKEPELSKEEWKIYDDLRGQLETFLPEIMLESGSGFGINREDVIRYCRVNFLKTAPDLQEKLLYYINRDYFGYGIIDAVVNDTNIEDISCVGPGIPLFVYHSKYDVLKTNLIFRTPDSLSSFLVRLAQKCKRSISVRNPILDGTTSEGHRIEGTYGREITSLGSSFTIRLFRKKVFSPADILNSGMADSNILAYLWLAVENLESAMIAGPPGSGKTSFLNAMMSFAPSNTKILTIEETRELNIQHPNCVSTATREIPSEMMGYGTQNLTLFDLVKSAMRQRPTYIVVGEVRGEETYSLFQAMSTGHTTYSTIHADSIDSLVNRLESEPMRIPRILISGLRIVIFLTYYRSGNRIRRRISEIDEISGVDSRNGEVMYNSVFRFNPINESWLMAGESLFLDRLTERMNETPQGMKAIFEKRKEDLINRFLKDSDNSKKEENK